MLVKNIAPIRFIFFRTECTVKELHSFIPVSQQLYQEAIKYDLGIMGPVQWHYPEFPITTHAPFTLEIGVPVGTTLPEYDGRFHFKESQPFLCVSCRHEGEWHDIPKGYSSMMAFLQKNGLAPGTMAREIYIHIDLENPAANVTELQLAISATPG